MLVLFLSDSHLSPPFLSLGHINSETHLVMKASLEELKRRL